jgi:SAM-dependent methyltransferase
MDQPDPRIDFFDEHAADWEAHSPPDNVVRTRLAELAELLGIRAGQQVLEVGCGTGQVTTWLLERVGPAGGVTALDFSAAMLERTGARAPRAECRQADVCADELGEARYDVVWCMHCFPHFRDQAAALANLRGALKPDGRLIILHLSNWQEINTMHASLGSPVDKDLLPPPDKWKSLLAGAGLAMDTLIDREDLLCVVGRVTGVVTESTGPRILK